MSQPTHAQAPGVPASVPTPDLAPSRLLDAMRWRYATKAFDASRKIPPETWNALEQMLVLSASSFGLQPYRFLVLDNPDLRNRLMPHSWRQSQVVDASHYVVFAARTNLTEKEIDAYVDLIARTRNVTPDSLAGYRSMMTNSLLDPAIEPGLGTWATHQAYIALGHLLTAAALLGIDTCPMEGFEREAYDRILSLTERGLSAAVCCALGYRAASDKAASLRKVRFPHEHLVQHL